MDTNRRRRVPRVLQCEGLETREMLSGLAPPAAEVRMARVHQIVSQGVIQGGVWHQRNYGNPASPDYGYSMAGRGSLSHLGEVAFQAQYRGYAIHPGPLNYTGEVTIRKGPANEIGFIFEGRDLINGGGWDIANWHGQFDHGSGIFAGASGTMTARVFSNHEAGRFVLRIRIKLDRA